MGGHSQKPLLVSGNPLGRGVLSIVMPSKTLSSLTQFAASIEEKALLTYQAMSSSDDVVLFLERSIGAKHERAVVIGANAAFCRISGYSREQLCGRSVTDLFPVADQAEALISTMDMNGSLRSEVTCRRADEQTFLLGMHLMPAAERQPGTPRYVILGRDITEVVDARKMQASIQHLLANVFSSVDAAVAIVSHTGRIVMTNPRVDSMLGYVPNGLVGRSSLDLVTPKARARAAAMIEQQLQDGHEACYCLPVLRADGTELVVRMTSVLATAGDAKQFRIVTLHRDTNGSPVMRSESVGRIKLVGLDDVRAALGDRWEAAAERAMSAAEAVMKRHCGPTDSFSRVDDTSFLLCFGSLDEEEATFRAAMIGREIRNRLIGQGDDAEKASCALSPL